MAGKQGQKSDKAIQIPRRYTDDFLNALDGRCLAAKAYKSRLAQLITDLGGPDQLSYQQHSLARRVIHLEVILEQMELGFIRTGEIQLGTYAQSINAFIGLFRCLGLSRRTKDLPNLADYIDQGASDD